MDGSVATAEPAKEQPGWKRLLASSSTALLPLCLEPCLILLVTLLPNRERGMETFNWSSIEFSLASLVAGALVMALGWVVTAGALGSKDSDNRSKPGGTAFWIGVAVAGVGLGLLAASVILEPRYWLSVVGFLLMLGVYVAVDRSTPSDSLLRDLIKPLVMVPLVTGIFGSDLTQHVFLFLLAYRALAGSLAIRGALNRTSDAMICRVLAVAMTPLIYIAVQEKVFGTPQNSYVFVCLWVVILAMTPFRKRVPWLLGLAEAGGVVYILMDWDYWMNVFTKGV